MKVDHYNNFTEIEKLIIGAAHQEAFAKKGIEKPLERFIKLFEIENPKVVVDHKNATVQIHKDNIKGMTIILRQFL